MIDSIKLCDTNAIGDLKKRPTSMFRKDMFISICLDIYSHRIWWGKKVLKAIYRNSSVIVFLNCT